MVLMSLKFRNGERVLLALMSALKTRNSDAIAFTYHIHQKCVSVVLEQPSWHSILFHSLVWKQCRLLMIWFSICFLWLPYMLDIVSICGIWRRRGKACAFDKLVNRPRETFGEQNQFLGISHQLDVMVAGSHLAYANLNHFSYARLAYISRRREWIFIHPLYHNYFLCPHPEEFNSSHYQLIHFILNQQLSVEQDGFNLPNISAANSLLVLQYQPVATWTCWRNYRVHSLENSQVTSLIMIGFGVYPFTLSVFIRTWFITNFCWFVMFDWDIQTPFLPHLLWFTIVISNARSFHLLTGWVIEWMLARLPVSCPAASIAMLKKLDYTDSRGV